MPDYLALLKQKQAERDAMFRKEDPETVAPQGQESPQGEQQQDPPPYEPTNQEITNELFRRDKHPIVDIEAEPLADNPYTWTPEYTQRGFVEEVKTSLVRGFGKHVVGSTGEIVNLLGSVLPGLDIREGNMLGRELQEVGRELEESNKVYMPDELKDNEFSLQTFLNPNFWSKTAAEYIPQLVEMILLSKGMGAATKGLAKGTVRKIGKEMSEEALEKYGKKAIVNTTGRTLGQAKQITELPGQGWQGFRHMLGSSFMTTQGTATEAFMIGSEMFGGGVGMNLLAGLQNAAGLVNRMKNEVDPTTGEALYTEEQLADMAASTVTENFKYLPIDALSYGLTYARTSGHFNKLNPFRRSKKPFFNQAEQLKATSKSFTREITPLMSALNKAGAKIAKQGKRAQNVANALAKPLFEGVEEQFQETWEEWAQKKAVAEATGGSITIDNEEVDGSLDSYFKFFMSKENEATRTIAMALGMLGGAGSNIVEAVNQKAIQQYKNFSKTELFKKAATSQQAAEYQSEYIKQQIMDNILDGNTDVKVTEAWIDSMVEGEVISEDAGAEWKGYAKEMHKSKEKIDAIGNINVNGKVAYLNNQFKRITSIKNLETAVKNAQAKKATLNEDMKNNPKLLKQKLKEVDDALMVNKEGFLIEMATAEKAIESILSGEKGDVARIKHVKDSNGNEVAIGLSEEDYNSYYTKTDKEIFDDARTKALTMEKGRGILGRFGKKFYEEAKKQFGFAVDKGKEQIEKGKEKVDKLIKDNTDEGIEGLVDLLPTNEEDFKKIKDTVIKLGDEDPIDLAPLKKLTGEALKKAIETTNKIIAKYNEKIKPEGGKSFKRKDTFDEEVKEEDQDKFEVDKKDNVVAKFTKEELEGRKRKKRSIDKFIEGSFTEKNEKNLLSGEFEMETQLKNAKIDFKGKNKKDTRAQVKALVQEEKGRIGEVLKAGATVNQLVNYLMDIGTNGAFKPETKSERIARENKNKARREKAARIDKMRKATPEWKNRHTVRQANRFNNPDWKNEYKKLKRRKGFNKEALQKEYEEYLESTIARISLEPSTIAKQITLNQHLRKLFPNTNIQAYAMSNMYEFLGENALGYAIGSSIFIDEKAWEQDEIFMHEFLHVHFSVTRGEPATKEILKAALADKELVARIKKIYEDQMIWAYKQKGWRKGKRKARARWGDIKADPKLLEDVKFQRERKDGKRYTEAYPLPLAQQEVILDELFVAYMQGPMSEKLTKYFTPRKDLLRRAKVKGWWKWLKRKAVENEDDTVNVIRALNQGRTVPVENLREHIINTFVDSLQGVDTTVKGRMNMTENEAIVTFARHSVIKKKLDAEFKEREGQRKLKENENYDPQKVVDQMPETPVEVTESEFVMEGFYTSIEASGDMLNEASEHNEIDLSARWDKDFNVHNIKNNRMIREFIIAYNSEANKRKNKKFEDYKKKQAEAKAKGLNQPVATHFFDEHGRVIDATFYEGLNESKFVEGLMDIAIAYESHVDFIDALEESKVTAHQEFLEFLKKHSKGQEYTRLKEFHLIYANSVDLPVIISRFDKNGVYSTVSPQASQDAGIIATQMRAIETTSGPKQMAVREAIITLRNEQESFQDTPESINAVETIMKFYGYDQDIVRKILNDGNLLINGKLQPIKNAITDLIIFEDFGSEYIIDKNGKVSKTQYTELNGARTLIEAIVNYGKKFDSKAVVVGPTNNQISHRMFASHATKLMDKMAYRLKNSENTAEAKKAFIEEFTNLNSRKERESRTELQKMGINPLTNFNPLIESYWDNYHKTGEIPHLSLHAGSQNEFLNRNKNAKDQSAEQQLLNELMMFQESQNKEAEILEREDEELIIKEHYISKNYEEGKITLEQYEASMEAIRDRYKHRLRTNYQATLDTLGDSSRRLTISAPRIDGLLNSKQEYKGKDGKFTETAERHMAKMYEIYTKLTYDRKKFFKSHDQDVPVSYQQFKEGIISNSGWFENYLNENAGYLVLIKQFQDLFSEQNTKDGKKLMLNDKGKKLVREYSFNRTANTLYIHEMTSPGLHLKSITKIHKGQIAPVIALDPNLTVEQIPVPNEYDIPKPLPIGDETQDSPSYIARVEEWEKNRIITNDGVQYILEEHAKMIEELYPDFNKGFKIYSHHIEKDNPFFKDETSQMKGYTTVLTEEDVTVGNQQHLYPIWKLLKQRSKKFKESYENTYQGETYNPKFREHSSHQEKRPIHFPIITPVSADKTLLFHQKELHTLEDRFTVQQLAEQKRLDEFTSLLDRMYYPKSGNGQFLGLNGENFGPQQIMDKRYNRATFSVQATTTIPFGMELKSFFNALEIQNDLSKQKSLNLKQKVFDKLANFEGDDYAYSKLILDTANELDSDPYTIRALTMGEMPYSPHVAQFVGYQFRALMIRHGNNLQVRGSYGQTISDQGYKLTMPIKWDAKGNVTQTQEVFINGSSKLPFYGTEEDKQGRKRTTPFGIIAPRSMQEDNGAEARQYFWGDNALNKAIEGLIGKEDELDEYLRKGVYMVLSPRRRKKAKFERMIQTIKRIGLDPMSPTLRKDAEKYFQTKKVFADKQSKNLVGYYIPGETILTTRIPNSSQSFVGVAEIVGFHNTGASNIMAPSQYINIIGADHDGDALFLYQKARRKDGSFDERTLENTPEEEMQNAMGYWNRAHDRLVDQWLSKEMRETLETPLVFEKEMDKRISAMDQNIRPEKYERINKIHADYKAKKITKAQRDEQIAIAKTEQEFIMPFGPQHFTQQYNNSVIAKQTLGFAMNAHRAINFISAYDTELANGRNADGTIKLTSINLSGNRRNKFTDEGPRGKESRIHLSTIITNVVMDSTKNGHADAMNLNIHSISQAVVLINLGYSLTEVGYLFNHPAAVEYINKRKNIGNDYIDSGSYQNMVRLYNDEYGQDLGIYSNPSEFNVEIDPNHPAHKTKANSMNVIKLMHYLTKVSEDLQVVSTVMAGHSKLSTNPFVVDKQIKTFEQLLDNKKPSSRNNNVLDQTLYFGKGKTANQVWNEDRTKRQDQKIHIRFSPEANHYVKVAKEYSEHLKRINIAHNTEVKELFDNIAKQVTLKKLTDQQLEYFMQKIYPFIYSRLLGINNMDPQDVAEIFDDTPENEQESIEVYAEGIPGVPTIIKELKDYTEELDEIVHWQDPDNGLNKDTELTRSLVFNRGLKITENAVMINPQILQQHYSEEDIKAIQEDFAKLPLDLQKKLVIYDLIKYSWNDKRSIYPILPYNITSYVTARAKQFMNNPKKLPMDQVLKVLLDLETVNPELNNLPKVYIEGFIEYDGDPNSREKQELLRELQKNKFVKNRILNPDGKPMRVTVVQNKNGKPVPEVIQVNSLWPMLNASQKARFGDKSYSASLEYNQWNKPQTDLMTSKPREGYHLYERPAIENLANIPNSIAADKTLQNIHLTLIPDLATRGDQESEFLPAIMNDKYMAANNAERTEAKKKRIVNNGRFYKNLELYTSSRELSQQEILDAYEYKQQLTAEQEGQIINRYIRDKEAVERNASKWVDEHGDLLKEDPDTKEPFTEKKLLQGYNTWATRDAFAAARILVPITLELINRSAFHQSNEITKVQEGQDDISVWKAWLQTNNIDSTHPATQAIQRELETEFKEFTQQRKTYMQRIKDVTDKLYQEKLNYSPVRTPFLKKVQIALKLLFKNRDAVYQTLYGNIITKEDRTNPETGELQKRYTLLPESVLQDRLITGKISQAEYDFAKVFREITTELDPRINDSKYVPGGIPQVGMSRLEAFGRKGLLGLLVSLRPHTQKIYDVKLKFDGGLMSFKSIEDIFRQERPNDWKNNKEYLQLRYRANRLYEKGINEDGSKFELSKVFSHTLAGDGMINQFANGGWINQNQFLSMDLNRALVDFTHTQLFITGNKQFKGFKALQAKVDGLLIHNRLKGFTNQNKFVRKVYKEYFLRGKKLNDTTRTDKVIDAFVRGNLLYIMGWKMLAVGKGAYVIGNALIGKYMNIKNEGGKTWALGEKRYWGVSEDGVKHRKASGVLKTLNFMDINLYDDVNFHKSTGLDSIFTEIALSPMLVSERWIQGAHFLGLLTEEEWNSFDDNGNYLPGAERIDNQRLTEIENQVKSAHGKGYTPTDQRMIQRYSWGRAIMQFSRFIPTIAYDRFAKEDINIYGQKHIGSLRAVWEPIAKYVSGEADIKTLKSYRANLDAETRARFDSGLRGLAMVSVAILGGVMFDSNYARELAGDANYLFNQEKLEFKLFPSSARTIVNLAESII